MDTELLEALKEFVGDEHQKILDALQELVPGEASHQSALINAYEQLAGIIVGEQDVYNDQAVKAAAVRFMISLRSYKKKAEHLDESLTLEKRKLAQLLERLEGTKEAVKVSEARCASLDELLASEKKRSAQLYERLLVTERERDILFKANVNPEPESEPEPTVELVATLPHVKGESLRESKKDQEKMKNDDSNCSTDNKGKKLPAVARKLATPDSE